MNLTEKIAVRANKTLYRDGDRVIKLFGAEFSTTDIFNEAFNLAAVGENGVNAPELIEVVKIDGHWAIVMQYIEGETLAALMEKNPEKTAEYLDRFVEIQLELHRRAAPRLRLLVEKMHKKISASGLEATIRYELHTRLDSLPRAAVICHGDFNPTNVVIDRHGDAHVIDWSHATHGAGTADAARTFLLFSLAKQEALANQYLDIFCRKSDTAKQLVQKWIPLTSAARLAKCQPDERELLRNWASVVEYQ